MPKSLIRIAILVVVASVGLLMVCAPPQVPTSGNPTFAAMKPQTGTFPVGEAVRCTLTVDYPQFADSFQVRLIVGTVDTVLQKGTTVASSMYVSFDCTVVGAFRIKTVLYMGGTAFDSIEGAFVGAASVPVVTASASLVHIYVGDSVTVRFDAADPDSNLWWIITRVDRDGGTVLDTTRANLPKQAALHASKVVRGTRFDTVFCQAWALDNVNQFSPVAACTVVVADTSAPVLHIVKPADTNAVIADLPCSLLVVATDASPIDSAEFNGDRMDLFGDTAFMEITSLDSGMNVCTLSVWDKAGNAGVRVFTLEYRGLLRITPHIKPLGFSAPEGGTFDTLVLDTCVTLENPPTTPANYIRDSLKWQITDPTGGLIATYDSTTRRLAVRTPDVNWNGTEAIGLRATAYNGKWDAGSVLYQVTAVNDAPIVTISNKSACGGKWWDTLSVDTSFYDVEDARGTRLEWLFLPGKRVKVDSVKSSPKCPPPPQFCLYKPVYNGRITFKVDSSRTPVISADSASRWVGVDTVRAWVKDRYGTWSAEKKIVVSRSSICRFLLKETAAIKQE